MPTSTNLRTPGVKFSFDTTSFEEELAEIIKQLLPPEKMVKVAIAGGNVIRDEWKLQELPHTVTGEYQETIQVLIDDVGSDFIEIAVGTTAKQARFLEYGTSRQVAQPVMRPAYDISKEPAKKAMREEMIRG